MAGSGVRISWASTIVGDEPPSSKPQQPPREVKIQDQVNISVPPFNGRYNPALYIEWEFELNSIFLSHKFSEREKVKTAVSTFTDFASSWWSEYCRSYCDYIPRSWYDLKLAMRHRFVPSYFTRDMVRKLEQLIQGSNTVKEYYDALQTALLYSFIEETEDDFMDRFWRGLNRDIHDIIMNEELYSVDHLFRLACKGEQKIRRCGHKTNKCATKSPSSASKKVTSTIAAPRPVTEPMWLLHLL